MQIIQQTYEQLPDPATLAQLDAIHPHVLLVFGPPVFFEDRQLSARLKTALPDALPIGCSSGGNVGKNGVHDGSLQITAIHFADPALSWTNADPAKFENSFTAGQHLGQQLAKQPVRHVLLFSQRQSTNNHQLLQGLQSILPGVPVTGGVACNPLLQPGSYTLDPSGISESHCVALGLCSPQLQISCGISSGWRPFGPARLVTHSKNNILYALDGAPALDMYKRYLGQHMHDWAHARLLFSFEILDTSCRETGLIRAVQAYNENDGSLILTDDIQEGSYMRLMHASTNALVGGAEAAMDQARKNIANTSTSLAFVVSCVGRRIIMGQQSDEEIEAILPYLRASSHLSGFYAHGEFGTPAGQNQLPHILNETLSVTLLSEMSC